MICLFLGKIAVHQEDSAFALHLYIYKHRRYKYKFYKNLFMLNILGGLKEQIFDVINYFSRSPDLQIARI